MAKANESAYYLGNENLPKPEAVFEWTPLMLRNMKKCEHNILFFAENFFFIVNPDRGKEKIKLHKYQKRILRALRDNRFTIVLSSRQSGKALDVTTPIPTPTGFKQMGDLVAGDLVYNIKGNPCKVLHAHEVLYGRDCYEIEFDNGEKIIADGEHLWFTQSRQERNKKLPGSVKTTKDILANLVTGKKKEPCHRIPSVTTGVQNEEKELPIHPYILGLWLGDGSCDSGVITAGKRDAQELIDILSTFSEYQVIVHEYKKGIFSIRLGCKNGHIKSEVNLSAQLKEENLWQNKHIPSSYLLASRDQRLELLKGLIDSDGYIDTNGNAQFYNTNLPLVQQVKQLIESLGYKTTSKSFIPKLNGKECAECGVVSFKPREEVAKLSFKTKRIKKQSNLIKSDRRNQWHYIKNVTPCKSVPVRCITVDSEDGLYLCSKQYIPTHNTTLMTIYALWVLNFFKDQRILLVANKEATAINIFKRIRMAYELLPNYLKSGVIEYAKTGLTLANGSSIGISTTSSDAGRGDSVNVLIVDEMAFVPHELMTEFWNSVYPIISASTKSKIFIASTPNGTDNLFYKQYRDAEKGTNNWKAERVDWWDVPGRDEQWKENTIKEMGSIDAFEQEFGNKFFQTGESAAPEEIIEKLKQNCREPKFIFDEGAYRIWEEPRNDAIYIAGTDVSEGVGEAASVVHIFDMTNLRDIRQVASYHNRKITPYLFTTKLLEILTHWGKPLLAIERNNCGGQVIDQLINTHSYENIVNFSPKESDTRKGCIAHTNTKYKGIVNMRYWVNQLNAVIFRDIATVNELKDFVRFPNGTWAARAGTDTWDDRVMALVWSLIALESTVTEKYFEIIKYDDNKKPLIIRPTYQVSKITINPVNMFENEVEVGGTGRYLPSMFNTTPLMTDPEEGPAGLEELLEAGWEKY